MRLVVLDLAERLEPFVSKIFEGSLQVNRTIDESETLRLGAIPCIHASNRVTGAETRHPKVAFQNSHPFLNIRSQHPCHRSCFAKGTHAEARFEAALKLLTCLLVLTCAYLITRWWLKLKDR